MATPPPQPRNRLLAALPPADLAGLWPRLEPVEYTQRTVIHAPGETITAILFPETGWISMLALLLDGNAAEVGIVGIDGMVGLPLLLGSDSSPVEAIIQVPGTMLRLHAEAFHEEVERRPALRTRLLRYALAFQAQVAQTAACNGHHALDQRLARWLLMAHDRAVGDEFPMTQDLLALMLCVHRPGVTVAARLFQQAGLIRYGGGHITITDRTGLEAAACECHAAVKREVDRLLGPA